jgi:hypothetical protein
MVCFQDTDTVAIDIPQANRPVAARTCQQLPVRCECDIVDTLVMAGQHSQFRAVGPVPESDRAVRPTGRHRRPVGTETYGEDRPMMPCVRCYHGPPNDVRVE